MGEKILVVEDERVLRETLAYNLTKQGYVVTTAADGKTAVALARQEAPDLVLLDIMLPGLGGFEVCRVLRQEMRVPILMLTARTDEVDKIVCGSRTVDVHVRWLREKIEPDPAQPVRIVTVRGAGYRFEG